MFCFLIKNNHIKENIGTPEWCSTALTCFRKNPATPSDLAIHHAFHLAGCSLVPRPIPNFSMLHAEKQEGLVHEITCAMSQMTHSEGTQLQGTDRRSDAWGNGSGDKARLGVPEQVDGFPWIGIHGMWFPWAYPLKSMTCEWCHCNISTFWKSNLDLHGCLIYTTIMSSVISYTLSTNLIHPR